MTPTVEEVRTALSGVKDPEIRRPITDLGMVESISVLPGGVVEVTVLLTIAACPCGTRSCAMSPRPCGRSPASATAG